MEISIETKEFVNRLDNFSHHKLKNLDSVSLLIELARANDQWQWLKNIAFLSKFLSNVHGILQRSPSEAEECVRLKDEFRSNLEKVAVELKAFIEMAPMEIREKFSSTYLSLTVESVESLVALLYDLSWVKNWSIDQAESN